MAFLTLLLFFTNPDSPSAGVSLQDSVASSPQAVFRSVEQGIRSGTIGSLAPFFGKQVSMTIRGSESGVFSSAQALTILKSYFSGRKLLQFSFSQMVDSVASPYATGRMILTSRGGKESVQVYLSLTRQDSQWVLTQFNLY